MNKKKVKFLTIRVKVLPVDTPNLSSRNPHKSLYLKPFSDNATRSNKIDMFLRKCNVTSYLTNNALTLFT